MRQKNKLAKPRKRIRFIQRQEVWMPTLEGWIVALISLVLVLIFSISHLYPFLAVSSPIKADVLVVEGWMPDYALKEAITEFNQGNYRQIITTGLPVEKGFYLAEYKDFAELTAATLRKLGFNKEKLVAVPGFEVKKDRTYAAAIALRDWFYKSDLQIKSINLYSFDAHSRRSWLIYKQVLAPNIQVGVIAGKEQTFTPQNWWRTSEGVRSVISETIAYIYARFRDWRK